MTDVAPAVPTSAPIQAPATVSTPKVASTGNTSAEVADNKEIKTASPFMDALEKEMQGLAPGSTPADGAAMVDSELLPQVASAIANQDGSALPFASAITNQDGSALPLSGQTLPLDPSVLSHLPVDTGSAGDGNEIKDGDQILNKLVKEIQANAVTSGALVATPELKTTVGSATKSDSETAKQHGSALPTTDQIDPGVVLIVPAVAVPTIKEQAALLLGKDPGNTLGGSRPDSNSTPVATAVAKVTAAQAHDSAVIPGLLAATVAQQKPVALTSFDALKSESAHTFSLPAASTAPAALASVLSASSPVVTTSSAGLFSAPPAITVPLGQPGWDQALGQRVQWLVGQQMQGAELRITPPHLGPMEVRISIGQDQQTTINFTSPHGVVRDAIEAALPRLRDMLGDNGMTQVNVNVSQHSFAEQRRQGLSQGNARGTGYAGDFDMASVEKVTDPVASGRAVGLVDYFA